MINESERVSISNMMIDAFEDFLVFTRNVDFSLREKSTEIIIKQIHTSCIQHSQALLSLIREDYIWEAEMLLRTMMEGTIKLAYLTCDLNLVETKLYEYSRILPFLSGMKRKGRIEEILNITSFLNIDGGFEVLKKIVEMELPVIDSKISRKELNKIKMKWDIMSMLESIQKSGVKQWENIFVLKYPYGTMSSIAHMDYDGINYIHERLARNDEEREKVDSLHMCRIYSDVYWFMHTRMTSICLLYDTNQDEIHELQIKHQVLLDSIENQRKLNVL